MTDQETCPKCGELLPPDVTPGHCPKCLMQVAFESEAQPLSGPATASSGQGSQTWNLDQLASLFPELEIIDKVGTGGMGVVYKAKQTQLDRLVAVKLVRPDLCDDPSFAERFTREARAMARLSHPAIINVFDFGQRENFYFFIMEFVDGANLRQLVRSGELDSKSALAVVPQICDALQYAHDAGIVHRDIKPENIMLDKSGRVKIADFGLAKLVKPQPDDFTLTGTKQVVGTPHYMAPEQFEHPTEVDHRADIYSVGVVIYEMLTGELPLGRFALPSEKVQVDVRLDEIVLRALQKEPELRYQQVTEIKTGVEYVAATPTGQPSQESAFPSGDFKSVDNEAGDLLRRPAYGLIASSIIDACALAVCLLMSMFVPVPEAALAMAFPHVVCFAVYIGAREIQRRGSYRWAIAASVLAMIPLHWGALLGIPFGCWSLMILLKQQTKSEFSNAEDFAPEIQVARDFTISATRTAGKKLKELPWTSVFSRTVMGATRQFGRLTSTGIRLMIWTLICVLTFIGSVVVVTQHASWTFDVVDRTAQGLKGDSGQIDLLATGSQSHTGVAFDLRGAIRDKISISLRPKLPQGRKGPGHVLSISIPEMEYRTSRESMQISRPFDADTILDWIESAGVDTTDSNVAVESEVLNSLVYEVAKDQKLGVRSSRSLANLLRRNVDVFDTTRMSSRYGLIIRETPEVVPMAVACALNAILWLSGLAIILVNVFRRRDSDSEARPKSRLMVFVTAVTILSLWTLVGFLARPLAATLVPRALSEEFPSQFEPHDPSAAFIADLGLCVAWTIGMLIVTLPAWVLWRNRSPRVLEAQSNPDEPTTAVESPNPAAPNQTLTSESPDEDRDSE
ncbi:MAG: putative Ser/Thr protein kinase [Porticoccaceae bacterium]|jgi:predicted Ser/Thr protein kinase